VTRAANEQDEGMRRMQAGRAWRSNVAAEATDVQRARSASNINRNWFVKRDSHRDLPKMIV
jgi:hypothetical protein